MTNIYIVMYIFEPQPQESHVHPGFLSFTAKNAAIEAARYYRDELHCAFVALRHDRQCNSGWCDIIGFIDF